MPIAETVLIFTKYNRPKSGASAGSIVKYNTDDGQKGRKIKMRKIFTKPTRQTGISISLLTARTLYEWAFETEMPGDMSYFKAAQLVQLKVSWPRFLTYAMLVEKVENFNGSSRY